MEIDDQAGEGRAYGNIGNAYKSLGNYRKVIECIEKDMKIAIDIRDRAAEGRTYGSIGNAYDSLGVLSSPGQFTRHSSFSYVNYSTGFSSLGLSAVGSLQISCSARIHSKSSCCEIYSRFTDKLHRQ